MRNREFAVVTYLFLAIFLSMIAYFAYFQIKKSETFINSPYNARQDSFGKRVTRGDIVASNGEILATTKTAEDGTETREYPYGRTFAHAVGFSTNGKSGIESFENFQLLRSHAFFLEKIYHEIKNEKNMGDTVVTTLDTRVQNAAYQALGSYRGAVFALQPSTGKIICMVSKPDYDPNTIAANWEFIISEDNTDSVLLNRVTQGLYPPGSTFKLFTLLEYMRENRQYGGYSYICTGNYEKDGNAIHCFNNEVHGEESLRSSFADSCNTSFANIGLGLNLGEYRNLCSKLLFDSDLPCEYTYQSSKFRLTAQADSGQVMQTAIGQGETEVTPYHLALVLSAIDNGGVLMTPHIIDKITNYSGTEVSHTEETAYKRLLSEKQSAILKEYLNAVVTEGTASALNGQSYSAGGKTGSAEYTDNKDSHAWFVGYASKDGYEDLAIAVVLEGAGTGSAYAVPVAKAVFDTYFN